LAQKINEIEGFRLAFVEKLTVVGGNTVKDYPKPWQETMTE